MKARDKYAAEGLTAHRQRLTAGPRGAVFLARPRENAIVDRCTAVLTAEPTPAWPFQLSWPHLQQSVPGSPDAFVAAMYGMLTSRRASSRAAEINMRNALDRMRTQISPHTTIVDDFVDSFAYTRTAPAA